MVSDAQHTQRAVRCGEVPQGTGEFGGAEQAQQADGEVAQGGHDARSVRGAHLGAVFVEGDVAHLVGAVLDGPVPAVELEEALGIGLLGGEAGQAVDVLGAAAVSFGLAHEAFNVKDLSDVGEVEVVVKRARGG